MTNQLPQNIEKLYFELLKKLEIIFQSKTDNNSNLKQSSFDLFFNTLDNIYVPTPPPEPKKILNSILDNNDIIKRPNRFKQS